MPTNARTMYGRGTLIFEASDNKSYRSITLSNIAITGSQSVGFTLSATVNTQDVSFTDANFTDAIRRIFGIAVA